MYLRNIITTLSSKGLIMLLSFGLVVLSTNLWGTEGRGVISIIIADVAIIVIFNNLLGGSCITYFTPKLGAEKLILPAYAWVAISSLAGALIFYLIQPQIDFWYLFLLSFFLSLQAIHLKIFLAKEKFGAFNSFSLLLPLLNIVFLFLFEWVVGLKSYKSYLAGYLLALIIIWLLTAIMSRKYFMNKLSFSFEVVRKALAYGWQVELSNFLHFFNYRLSYFLILYLIDLGSVGLYSVGIALAEAIWLIVRSISLVQYSKIVNNIEPAEAIKLTISSAKISLYFSLAVAIILLIVPTTIYTLVFGKDFSQVKEIMLYLLPGIIAISFSNIHGHYFSATGNPRPLIMKSLLGLAFTAVSGPIFIYYAGLPGAGIITSVSYIASSIYLILAFYKNEKFSFAHIFIKPKILLKKLR